MHCETFASGKGFTMHRQFKLKEPEFYLNYVSDWMRESVGETTGPGKAKKKGMNTMKH